ncbi:hypothetical protein DFJ73DRAFT_514255 [Zopfochytrium polystomum]|nr:hypothetical protein DFJ73DRAFT_514255 [Zopfochytrium polystomum]
MLGGFSILAASICHFLITCFRVLLFCALFSNRLKSKINTVSASVSPPPIGSCSQQLAAHGDGGMQVQDSPQLTQNPPSLSVRFS